MATLPKKAKISKAAFLAAVATPVGYALLIWTYAATLASPALAPSAIWFLLGLTLAVAGTLTLFIETKT